MQNFVYITIGNIVFWLGTLGNCVIKHSTVVSKYSGMLMIISNNAPVLMTHRYLSLEILAQAGQLLVYLRLDDALHTGQDSDQNIVR